MTWDFERETLHYSNATKICLSKSETKLRKLGFHAQINWLVFIEANLSGCIYVFENSYPVSLLLSLSRCKMAVK